MSRSIRVVPQKLFQWKAEAGEHSYEVKLYRVEKEKEVLEDSSDGRINVARADQQFVVSLEAFPRELDGGGTVFFTVHVKNYLNSALPLSGFVEDEDGAVIKKIDGFEGRVPANGEKNISFSYTIHSIGNHTFRVFLDNYDGKPNGAGEEHWAEVMVKVVGKIASPNLDCTKEVYPGEPITCVASWNSQISVDSLELRQIWFGGKKAWEGGTSSVKSVIIDSKSYTLTPSDTVQVRIILDDDFANWYFGKDPLDPLDASYKEQLGGYTYSVKFVFEDDVISDALVMVKDRGVMEEAKAFVSDIKNDIEAGEYVTAGLLVLKAGGKVAKVGGMAFTVILIGVDIHDWLFAPNPDSGFDNNDVVGG